MMCFCVLGFLSVLCMHPSTLFQTCWWFIPYLTWHYNQLHAKYHNIPLRWWADNSSHDGKKLISKHTEKSRWICGLVHSGSQTVFMGGEKLDSTWREIHQTSKSFFAIIENSKFALREIIEKHLRPGSNIWTDRHVSNGWLDHEDCNFSTKLSRVNPAGTTVSLQYHWIHVFRMNSGSSVQFSLEVAVYASQFWDDAWHWWIFTILCVLLFDLTTHC
jgi:hypothetical protein